LYDHQSITRHLTPSVFAAGGMTVSAACLAPSRLVAQTDGSLKVRSGASILAHENTRKHLSEATRVEGNWQHTSLPPRRVRFPPQSSKTNTLYTSTTLLSCSSTTCLLTLIPMSPCILLRPTFFIPETLFWNRDYPFIDYATGGGIDGHIPAAEANIARVTGKTIVIPGHGSGGQS